MTNPGTTTKEMMPEGQEAGSVGDVGPIGDEWSFTLFDHQEREIVAFVFGSEGDARRAVEDRLRLNGQIS